MMPMISANTTKMGNMTNEARNRGTIRYFTGFVARVWRASICSVTRIVPNSAAIADPTRPETINPVSTGPNSLVTDRATTVPTSVSA